jgi:hypothetical protein
MKVQDLTIESLTSMINSAVEKSVGFAVDSLSERLDKVEGKLSCVDKKVDKVDKGIERTNELLDGNPQHGEPGIVKKANIAYNEIEYMKRFKKTFNITTVLTFISLLIGVVLSILNLVRIL